MSTPFFSDRRAIGLLVSGAMLLTIFAAFALQQDTGAVYSESNDGTPEDTPGDPTSEVAKLEKELARLEAELAKAKANPAIPQHVVDKLEEGVRDLRAKIDALGGGKGKYGPN